MKKTILVIFVLIVLTGCTAPKEIIVPPPDKTPTPVQQQKTIIQQQQRPIQQPEPECSSNEDCKTTQTCIRRECKDIICKECQIIQNRRCVPLDCCSDVECADDEVCEQNECAKLDCDYCWLASNHKCYPLSCCSDLDCDDDNPATRDWCSFPGTSDAACSSALIETDTVSSSQEDETENVSCTFDSECPESEFCLARRCETIEEFYSHHFGCCEQGVTVTINNIDYSDCGFMATLTDNMKDCSQISCPTCTIGTQTCVAHPKRLENLPFYNYCAECLSNSQCKTGYSCVNQKCV